MALAESANGKPVIYRMKRVGEIHDAVVKDDKL
jgi:hypothetical protein